jgi:hypothetical protein
LKVTPYEDGRLECVTRPILLRKQSRRFGRQPITFDLPRSADIRSIQLNVANGAINGHRVQVSGRRDLKGHQLIATSQSGVILMRQLWTARIALLRRDKAANGQLSR